MLQTAATTLRAMRNARQILYEDDLLRTRQKDGQLYGWLRNTPSHMNGSISIPYLYNSHTTRYWRMWWISYTQKKNIKHSSMNRNN